MSQISAQAAGGHADLPARARRSLSTDLGRRAGVSLVAGLTILPGAVGVSIVFYYLGEWPTANPFDQVFWGAVTGVAFWLIVSVTFLRGFADVESADAATYSELVQRTASLRARLTVLGATSNSLGGSGTATTRPDVGGLPAVIAEVQELVASVAAHLAEGDNETVREMRAQALAEAYQLLDELTRTLRGESSGPALRWSGASGYISAWRQLHRAEEALLAGEAPEVLYAEALDDEARLMKTKVDDAEILLHALRALLGEPNKRRSLDDAVTELEKPAARELLRKIRYALDSYRDDLFQRFVRVRNAMFATLVYVALVGDGVLALAILALPRRYEAAVIAGMSYYLIGALVGLFAELYGASRGQRGAVHDYGLALVRLLTIPVLSGIAAVLGVAITRLGGAATATNVALTEVFSLRAYPMGVVVAALFGLTPGLLLERLRAETNEVRDELTKSASGTPTARAGAQA